MSGSISQLIFFPNLILFICQTQINVSALISSLFSFRRSFSAVYALTMRTWSTSSHLTHKYVDIFNGYRSSTGSFFVISIPPVRFSVFTSSLSYLIPHRGSYTTRKKECHLSSFSRLSPQSKIYLVYTIAQEEKLPLSIPRGNRLFQMRIPENGFLKDFHIIHHPYITPFQKQQSFPPSYLCSFVTRRYQ